MSAGQVCDGARIGVAGEAVPREPSNTLAPSGASEPAPSGASGPSGTGRHDTEGPPLAFGQALDAATLAAIAADAAANAPLAWSRQWQPFGVPPPQPHFAGKGFGKSSGGRWAGEQPWAPWQWEGATPTTFPYPAWPDDVPGPAYGQPSWSEWSQGHAAAWQSHPSFGNTPDCDLAPEPAQADESTKAEISVPAASPAVDIDRSNPQKFALGLLQQMKHEGMGSKLTTTAVGPTLGSVDVACGVEHSTNTGDCDNLHDNMTSAVQKFLAGDGFEDSDSDSETEFFANAQDRDLALQRADVYEGGVGEICPAKFTSVATAADTGFDASTRDSALEIMNEFMLILRRRTLPVEFTEERRQQIHSVIFSCVLSLYRDRIKPVQSHVQRRLRERGQSEQIVRLLLPLCARESQYSLLPPVHGEQPIILLTAEPGWFEGWVDVEDPVGDYNQDVWDDLVSFLHGDGVALPQKPYLAAVELRQRNIRHLQSLTLGEIEHVVRLALGERRLLGLHEGQLKPTRIVQQLQAQDKGERSRPLEAGAGKVKQASGGSQDSGWLSDITDRDDLTVVLLHLMQRFPDGLSLSRIKPHLRMLCQRNLNEAAFECSQLAEVFKLPPLCHIFPLEQTPGRNETVVKPPRHSAIPPHIWQKFYHYGPVSTDVGPDPGHDPGGDGLGPCPSGTKEGSFPAPGLGLGAGLASRIAAEAPNDHI